jgi:hypothetical protein
MTTQERPTVIGIFLDRTQAERAVEELRRSGFRQDQIGVVVRDEEPPTGLTVEADVRAEKGAATGAVAGGILGSLLGAATAVLLPGFGPVLVAGILAGVLGGGTIGITTGGLIGALVALGIPEDEAHHYERAFHAGHALVTVQTEGRSAEAVAVLRRQGAVEVDLEHKALVGSTH